MRIRLHVAVLAAVLSSHVAFGQFNRLRAIPFFGFHQSGSFGSVGYFDKGTVSLSDAKKGIGFDIGVDLSCRLSPRKWSAFALYFVVRPGTSQVKYTARKNFFFEGSSPLFDSKLSGTQILVPFGLRLAYSKFQFGNAQVKMYATLGGSARYAGNMTLHDQWVNPASTDIINYNGPAAGPNDKVKVGFYWNVGFSFGKVDFTVESFVMKGGEGKQAPGSMPTGYYSYYYNYYSKYALVPARVCLGYIF